VEPAELEKGVEKHNGHDRKKLAKAKHVEEDSKTKAEKSA
jgi:hypothetical protein